MESMIIFLTGFMGTGKTSVGRMLSDDLGFKFIDLDSEIELRRNLKISEIFEQFGEERFRKVESEVLKGVLDSSENRLVVSTGGGTFLARANRDLAMGKGIVICLKAEIKVLKQRLKNSSERPLLKIPMEKLMELRKEVYNLFPLQIDTSRLSIDEVVDKIKVFISENHGKWNANGS